MTSTLWCTFFVLLSTVIGADSFLTFPIILPSKASSSSIRPQAPLLSSSKPSTTTNTRPLYDGTNYTFPDTKTAAGFAEILEVSFVHACLQLSSGYVDVLKLFIACSIGSYEAGFSIDAILEELTQTKSNTANRLLVEGEIQLRRDWICVVYLTLSMMEYMPMASMKTAIETAQSSVPDDVRERYGKAVDRIGKAYRANESSLLSALDLMEEVHNVDSGLSKLVLKVATLTPTVVMETNSSQSNGITKPPTPPIEGAY